MIKKKLQVFISSTYIDLKDERQSAVEAILKADHIPAGMELFKAGNNSQLATIKKWIDSSDIYMLILGGRYGSIEEKTGKSYTQLEYEYALSRNIPCFAVILSDEFLKNKADTEKNIMETAHITEYDNFKNLVKTKMIKEVNDSKDIQIAIYESLKELEEEYVFSGWLPGDLIGNNIPMVYTMNEKKKTIKELKRQVDILNEQISYLEIKKALEVLSKKIQINYIEYERGIFSDKCQQAIPLSEVFVSVGIYLKNRYLSKHFIRKKLGKEIGPHVKILNDDVEKILSLLVNSKLILEEDFGEYISQRKYCITSFGRKILILLLDAEEAND